MANNRLRLLAVAVLALAAGFSLGARQAGVHIETGRADSTAAGGGSISTDGWTYGFSADIAWIDALDTRHEGLPDCLPPLSSVEDVTFAWVDATIEGTTWRPVIWIDCRGVPQPSEPPAAP